MDPELAEERRAIPQTLLRRVTENRPRSLAETSKGWAARDRTNTTRIG